MQINNLPHFVLKWLLFVVALPVFMLGLMSSLSLGSAIKFGRDHWADAVVSAVLVLISVGLSVLLNHVLRPKSGNPLNPQEWVGGYSRGFWMALYIGSWWGGFILGFF